MHLNPESLSFALLISDLGSIARAANVLGMKQATLSRNSLPLIAQMSDLFAPISKSTTHT
jgi:hypothetical protein